MRIIIMRAHSWVRGAVHETWTSQRVRVYTCVVMNDDLWCRTGMIVLFLIKYRIICNMNIIFQSYWELLLAISSIIYMNINISIIYIIRITIRVPIYLNIRIRNLHLHKFKYYININIEYSYILILNPIISIWISPVYWMCNVNVRLYHTIL